LCCWQETEDETVAALSLTGVVVAYSDLTENIYLVLVEEAERISFQGKEVSDKVESRLWKR